MELSLESQQFVNCKYQNSQGDGQRRGHPVAMAACRPYYTGEQHSRVEGKSREKAHADRGREQVGG